MSIAVQVKLRDLERRLDEAEARIQELERLLSTPQEPAKRGPGRPRKTEQEAAIQ